MVLAAKIFVVREENNLSLLASKLKNFKIEQELKAEDKDLTLVSDVSDMAISKESLEGTFSFDTVMMVNQRGGPLPITRTFQAPFSFNLFGKNLYLTIFEKKSRANSIANEMSKALFMSLGQIVEGRIQPDVLRRFHDDNFDDTKVIFFDDVDLPNISKLSLYGEALGSTTMYNDYLTHGKIWYAVVKSRKYGYVVGVTRNAIVTVFTRVDLPDFKRYLHAEILPLLS